ncbi:MAG: ABC-2 family transporter protein [Proteobacteria bacterium]|nr:ABC-2 family transporter protein [Pseudomonadota bacterium]
MKKLFTSLWRRNLAFAKLAIQTNLEYRLNFFTDAIAQPVCTALIEVTLWMAVFAAAKTELIGGFPKESYLAYAIWAAFMARISVSWMYEFRMIEEIDSGSINHLLVRPFTFFEYYLSQMMGYKLVTTLFSLIVPFAVSTAFDLPTDATKLPIVLLLVFYYLILVHILSLIVASIAFHLNRVHSMTVAKNLGLWLLSGELVPLDLIPSPYKETLLALPFCNAVYIPVGYITGRLGIEQVYAGFASITWSILIFGALSVVMWRWGIRKYVGTGA